MALNIVKHKDILLKILKDIFTDSAIGQFLGFKGGTAALLFYDLDRFSVDLDFDLLNSEKEGLIFERVNTILERYGIVKDVRKKRFNLFYLLSYDKKDVNAQNVKVEINRRQFGSTYQVLSHLGISMKVMVREDMAAHKFVAMFERIGRTNRDIFDVWFFLQHSWPINRTIIEERTHLSFREFLVKAIEALEGVDIKSILSGMGELLSEKQKVWARAKLKSETLFLLRLALENEIALSDLSK